MKNLNNRHQRVLVLMLVTSGLRKMELIPTRTALVTAMMMTMMTQRQLLLLAMLHHHLHLMMMMS